MFQVRRFTCENLAKCCVTDERTPRFSYAVESDRQGVALASAHIAVGDWRVETREQIAIPYGGAALRPFTVYRAALQVQDDAGERAEAECFFETGRMDTPWSAKWITDGAYLFREKKVSPVPMTFRRRFQAGGRVERARIYATAMGIYELSVNGSKAGDVYFAPGFTSYRSRLQYQTYDVTALLREENELVAAVGGGWAVGSFVFTRKNRITADRQAFLCEIRITYTDGREEIIGTDESWEVTEEGNYRASDFYDGETYDATVDLEQVAWRKAAEEKLKVSPVLSAASGAPVKAHERFLPVSCIRTAEGLVYDFGQNFAGVVELTLTGKAGQVVTVRHAELLNPDKTLNTAFLRTARATAVYICREGRQQYSPPADLYGIPLHLCGGD